MFRSFTSTTIVVFIFERKRKRCLPPFIERKWTFTPSDLDLGQWAKTDFGGSTIFELLAKLCGPVDVDQSGLVVHLPSRLGQVSKENGLQ
jgi:hypothetical protein